MKKQIMLVVLSLMVMSLLGIFAYAAVDTVTITQPLANDVLKGTAVEFNGTMRNQTAAGTQFQATNVSIYLGGSGSGNAQRVCNNVTVDNATGTWSCKVDINSLNENASAIFNVTVGNQTDTGSSARVTVFIDRTNPVARFKTQQLNANTNGDLPVSCSDSTDNIDGALTYQINLIKPSGVNASTVITSSTGSFRGGDLDQTGVYTLSCTVRDEAPLTTYKGSVGIGTPAAANSNRATTSITVSSGGSSFIQQTTGGTGTTPASSTPSPLVLGIIAVAAILIFRKK